MPKEPILQKSIYWLKVVSLGLALGIGVQFTQAWTNPVAPPPGGSVAGPITLGGTAQNKTEQLGSIGGGAYGTGAIRIGMHTLNSNNNGWLYLGNESNGVYGARGIAADYFYANTLSYSPIMYDANNTGYYVDPNGASNMNTVNAATFLYTSDIRLKENIIPLEHSLEKILQLNGYSFQWKENHRDDVGVIAQEVETQFPTLVRTNEETGMKSVEYGNLVAPLIEAVKELSHTVDTQGEQIQLLRSEIESLKSNK
ncbi:MAG: hypothetical protein QG581_190 [Patescibacteria group bacterium]|jgi:hypothetical protein|nr:hypothetical protein [Patescibacteria group bacterium]